MSHDPWGIAVGYENAKRQWVNIGRSTRNRLRQAMGDAGQPQPPDSPVRFVTPRNLDQWTAEGRIVLEDGARIEITRALPSDLPFGYHRFYPAGTDDELLLIHGPGVCVVPDKRHWGWAAQLYAVRSKNSWGFGDLGDLAELAKWSSQLGASLLQINPLHATAPTLPQEPSPYFPTSRRFRNPLYLRIEDVPGATALGRQLEELAAAGRALNAEQLIDRDAVFRLKMQALEAIWQAHPGESAMDGYVKEQGQALEEFAAYCVLAESNGPDWRRWPAEYARPTLPAARKPAIEQGKRIRFYQWIQWLLDEQLKAASHRLALMQDLPIGFDPGGADAWAWQDSLALDVTIGAPPDIHNPQGQNWGLPPWIPHKLQATGYRAFIETIRANLRHAGGLRIDHALGLFRQYWIPLGCSPCDGGFVAYPHAELLQIIALESHRAGAFVVGEDLGTTEPTMRAGLAEHRMLSTRLVWFEAGPPSSYPELSLAAITTHDLPTVVGLWTGADLEDQKAAGLKAPADVAASIRAQLRQLTALADEAPSDVVVLEAHKLLAKAASLLTVVTLEDALLAPKRINMPAASAWPSWRRALGAPLEEVQISQMPRAIAALFADTGGVV